MTIHLNSSASGTPTAFRTTGSFVKAEMPNGEEQSMLLPMLRKTLADAITLYLRAHGFHWNVVGTDFVEYHSLFGEIYSDVYESIDPLAENIRKLDGVAPFRLPELMAIRSIVDVPVDSTLPAAMATDLLAGNEAMLSSLNASFLAADAAGEQGIANFIAERIDRHQKWSWMLRSSLVG